MKLTTAYSGDTIDVDDKPDHSGDLRIGVTDGYDDAAVTLWLNRGERDQLRDHLAQVDGAAVAMPALERIAEAIESLRDLQPKPVTNVANFFDADPKDEQGLHGFAAGDRVVLVGPANPGGLFGVVDPDAYDCADWNSIPVRREDNGSGDGFPAQWTIPVPALPHAPQPQTLGIGEPYGDKEAWNKAAIEQAIERDLPVSFTYVKPAQRSRPIWDGERSHRLVRPQSIEQFGSYLIIKAYDLDADGDRAFRTDRIEGYVVVETRR